MVTKIITEKLFISKSKNMECLMIKKLKRGVVGDTNYVL